MLELIIITPCKRLENIPYIYSNIRMNLNTSVHVHWIPIFDKSEEEKYAFWQSRLIYLGSLSEHFTIDPLLSNVKYAIAGHAHRNIVLRALETISTKAWIYNLDDDNLLHPNLISFLLRNERKLKRKRGVIFSQQFKDGRLRLGIDKIKVGYVDTAMILFKSKYLRGLKFQENDYCGDGLFIENFYKKHKRKIYLEQTPLCYYNFLKP